MSQADLAARAGVSRKWIYEFEAGKPKAGLGLILRVMDTLGIQLVFCQTTRPCSPGGRATSTRPPRRSRCCRHRSVMTAPARLP